jgi:hypothetical protein
LTSHGSRQCRECARLRMTNGSPRKRRSTRLTA